MTKKNTSNIPPEYDDESFTVRVSFLDLGRLLLAFREHVDRSHGTRPTQWTHMGDWDVSFERLADAYDAGAQVFYGRRWTGPDYRMRCDQSDAYRWVPDHRHTGGPVTTVRVVEQSSPGADRGSHYVAQAAGNFQETLCGFGFTRDEGEVIDGAADCTACLREVALAEHLRATTDGPTS